MPARRSILVVAPVDDAFNRRIVRGVARCARERDWHVALDDRLPGPRSPRRVDGIVGVLSTDPQQRRAAALGVPVVNVSGIVEPSVLPCVLGDDEAIGAMVADYFHRHGLTRLACVGYGLLATCRRRQAALIGRARVNGSASDPTVIDLSTFPPRRDARLRRLVGALGELPAPVGVMAFNDEVGLAVCEAARLAGLVVPDEVAVVGVDDDEVLCELANPPLSSVSAGTIERGARAAELLETLMDGLPTGPLPIRVPPRRVAVRGSCDVLAIADGEVRRAMAFIRQRASEAIDVEDVMAGARCSRRSLEKRFLRATGGTIHARIWQAHIDRAKTLLATTDLSVLQIALRSGASSGSSLTQAFRRYAGTTPTAYRRRVSGR
jgi:LacI family transcriptional regulator